MAISVVRERLPDGREVAVIRMEGDVSPRDLRAFHEGLHARERMNPADGYVIDTRRLAQLASRVETEDIATDLSALDEPEGARRAVVADRPDLYGVSRQITALASLRGSRARYEIFRDYADALRWAAGD